VADSRGVPKTQGLRSVGNSVEDKTLKTRLKGINILKKKSQYAAVWLSCKRHRDRGSRGREVAVIAQRSRYRTVTGKDQKSRRDSRIAKRYPSVNAPGSNRLSGPGQEAPGSPVILSVKGDHGESEMKVKEVLVKVYEPGRLQAAWQQVRKNAGAAGIDQMTVEELRKGKNTSWR